MQRRCIPRQMSIERNTTGTVTQFMKTIISRILVLVQKTVFLGYKFLKSVSRYLFMIKYCVYPTTMDLKILEGS